MAAGCLPVLMAQTEDILPNLPFPHAINWPETVLFGGGLSCALKEKPEATTRGTNPNPNLNSNSNPNPNPNPNQATTHWVQALLRPENEKRLQCMARRAQRTFLRYLSLRDVGVVSAILHEIKVRARGRARARVRVRVTSPAANPNPNPNPIQPVLLTLTSTTRTASSCSPAPSS